MRQISSRMEIIHPTIAWRRDEHGTHKHPHDSWIIWSVSRVRSKTMHSLFCIASRLPYIILSYIDSRCFLPLEQSRTALLGYCLAASQLFARLLGNYFLGGQENITWPRRHNSNSSKSNFHPYRHFLWNWFTLRILWLLVFSFFYACTEDWT